MNLRDPADLGLLRTFHEVVRPGSVTQAARNLHLSQPAVSHRLQTLRGCSTYPLLLGGPREPVKD